MTECVDGMAKELWCGEKRETFWSKRETEKILRVRVGSPMSAREMYMFQEYI